MDIRFQADRASSPVYIEARQSLLANSAAVGLTWLIREIFCKTLKFDTRAQCRALLEADLARHAEALACIRQPLTDGQKAAFVSFAYNVGPRAFCDSTLAKKANAGDIPGACAELSKWVYAKGQRLLGLVKRRAAERAMCEGAGCDGPVDFMAACRAFMQSRCKRAAGLGVLLAGRDKLAALQERVQAVAQERDFALSRSVRNETSSQAILDSCACRLFVRRKQAADNGQNRVARLGLGICRALSCNDGAHRLPDGHPVTTHAREVGRRLAGLKRGCGQGQPADDGGGKPPKLFHGPLSLQALL